MLDHFYPPLSLFYTTHKDTTNKDAHVLIITNTDQSTKEDQKTSRSHSSDIALKKDYIPALFFACPRGFFCEKPQSPHHPHVEMRREHAFAMDKIIECRGAVRKHVSPASFGCRRGSEGAWEGVGSWLRPVFRLTDMKLIVYCV